MAIPTLSVRARGRALVTHYDALTRGIRCFVGRRLDASTIDPTTDSGVSFVPTGVAETVPATVEYVRHVQHGDLWAADQATATYCGVTFDPTFGVGTPASFPVVTATDNAAPETTTTDSSADSATGDK